MLLDQLVFSQEMRRYLYIFMLMYSHEGNYLSLTFHLCRLKLLLVPLLLQIMLVECKRLVRIRRQTTAMPLYCKLAWLCTVVVESRD